MPDTGASVASENRDHATGMCKLLLRNAFSDPGKVPDFLFQHPEVSIEDPVVELGIERLAQKLHLEF
jgi:hypothetical protein